nr:hypothetical protein [Planctomycetota bacterium]
VLPGALRDAGVTREQAVQACAACGLDTQRRLETLSAAELLALYAALGPAAAPPLQGAADDS